MPLHNLIGMVFGRLTVIERVPSDSKPRWRCNCMCGEITEVYGSNLKNGYVKSCGCWRKERAGGLNKSHGRTHTAEYKTWQSMRERCYYEKAISFPIYGKRGIRVCRRWQTSFKNFLVDMGLRPTGTSIDRIDPNGDYTPTNCRWVTRTVQDNNRRTSRFITIDGKCRSVADWARLVKCASRAVIYYRLNKGWEPKQAVFTPTRAWNRHSSTTE